MSFHPSYYESAINSLYNQTGGRISNSNRNSNNYRNRTQPNNYWTNQQPYFVEYVPVIYIAPCYYQPHGVVVRGINNYAPTKPWY